MRNRQQSSITANFVGQKGKGKGNEKGKNKGDKDNRPTCSHKPCGKKGYTINNYAMAHPERAKEIFAEVAKKKDAREKREKEKGKDNKKDDKKKGAFDVQVITALNVSALNSFTSSSSPQPKVEELRLIVEQMKTLVDNSITINRVASYSPVWHATIDSGA